jgi:hypothetical protein
MNPALETVDAMAVGRQLVNTARKNHELKFTDALPWYVIVDVPAAKTVLTMMVAGVEAQQAPTHETFWLCSQRTLINAGSTEMLTEADKENTVPCNCDVLATGFVTIWGDAPVHKRPAKDVVLPKQFVSTALNNAPFRVTLLADTVYTSGFTINDVLVCVNKVTKDAPLSRLLCQATWVTAGAPGKLAVTVKLTDPPRPMVWFDTKPTLAGKLPEHTKKEFERFEFPAQLLMVA